MSVVIDCPGCGLQVPEVARVCPKCGAIDPGSARGRDSQRRAALIAALIGAVAVAIITALL